MKLEQCLFGYDDGHRLLETSIPLGHEAAYLTELSDLAPGTVFGNSEGYWTGTPAPGINRYVLMRTWPAPEMSRPGCVWSHALLLEPSLFEIIYDLSILRSFFIRPLNNFSEYSKTLPMLISNAHAIKKQSIMTFVPKILISLYETINKTVVIDDPGEIDDSLFAVWSQQWPRLRRNFRFQTAATRGPQLSFDKKFDMSVVLSNSDLSPTIITNSEKAWVDAAAADAVGQANDSLRQFLWNYGADVRRQRNSFRPLVEVNLLNDRPESDSGPQILKIVTENFPDPKDALRLKQKLVDGEIVPCAQLDVIWYELTQENKEVFPHPTKKGINRLMQMWSKHATDLLYLAERIATTHDLLATHLFTVLSDTISKNEFWLITESYPRVRERMVAAQPELLLANDALKLDNSAMAKMFNFIPAFSPIINKLILSLIPRDDEKLASSAFDHFPHETTHLIINAANEDNRRLGRAWLHELVKRPHILLASPTMSIILRTSLLYEIANMLNWLTPEVVSAGAEPWMAALLNVVNDLSEDKRDILQAFFVALGVAAGGEAGRWMLEKFFDTVHEQELKSRLPWPARSILLPILAEVGWRRSWDYGLRLRLAIAATYVRNNYPPESYAGLSERRKVRKWLADAATDVPGGKPYAQAFDS